MIVRTLLDTDLYKFTTSYAYIKLFPYAMGTFSFNDRNETEYTEEFLEALKSEFNKLSRLRLTEEELEYMTRNCRFLPRVYWEWLSSFRFDPDKIDIHLDTTGRLHIEVSDFLYKVTLYEVPLLAIVSEIKNKFFGNVPDMSEILCKLSEKVELSNQHQLRFSEFGTRRRFSIDVQETVIKRLNDTAKYCTGTSNCYFAMKYGMKMMGTHPHEWFMFHGAQFGYKHAIPGQKFVFQMNEAEKAATRDLQNQNLAAALAQPCDLLVLDEAGSAWELDMVDKALLQQAVLHRPAGQECVLTAHAAPAWMLDAADYLTEMCCRRHPYQKGIAARKGVEY